jgi:hypothetical protein
VVLKLVASYRWNYGLDKLSTILEMKTFIGNQPYTQLPIMFISKNCTICSVHSFFHHLSSSLMAINFVRISPMGSVPSTQPLTHDEKLQDDLSEASTYDGADRRHWHVLYSYMFF